MDFTKAITYPFEDEEWLKKLGIAFLVSLLSFIPLLGTIPSAILLQGWSIEIIKRVKTNQPKPLAEWDDFGGIFNKGLWPFLGSLVYQIPTIILACISAAVWILPAAGGDNNDAAAGLAGAAGIASVCCYCVIILYAIAAGIVFWGGLMRYIDKPEFGTFMEFGENLALVRNNIGDFGMALLYLILGGLIVGVASSVTLGLIGLIATPFMLYFSSHVLGQLAQKLSASTMPQV
jgi:hypothetical protein